MNKKEKEIRKIVGKNLSKLIECREELKENEELIITSLKTLSILIEKEFKDKKYLLFIKEQKNSENSSNPMPKSLLILLKIKNLTETGLLEYGYSPLIFEMILKPNKNGGVDTEKSNPDYEALKDKKIMTEKCEKIILKHFMILSSLIEKLHKNDKEGVGLIEKQLKKFFIDKKSGLVKENIKD